MKPLLAIPLEAGNSLVVEVDEEPGIVRSARPGELIATASQTFESALVKVKPAAEALLATFRNLAESPDEITVDFGMKVTAEAGLVIAQGGAEANFVVKLAWRRPSVP
jgi:hypothetical protein